MDSEIIMSASLFATAVGFWLITVSKEKAQAIKQYCREEIARRARARVRRL